MSGSTRNRLVFGLCALMALALPGIAAAQSSSTFVIPFDRTGDPVLDALGNNVGGAFVNPCTFENVDVTGSTTVTIATSAKDAKGEFTVKVGGTTRGTGSGWIGSSYATATFTGSSYVLFENQDAKFVVPVLATTEVFDSTFSDKFSLKGQGPTDNWVIRAYFRLKIDARGNIQVSIERLNADVCKG